MTKIIRAGLGCLFLMIASIGMVGNARAEDNDNKVPYKEVPLSDPMLKEVWIQKGEDDTWWKLEDTSRKAFVASFKNDLNQKIVISEWKDRYACTDESCPVRILVDGKMIYQNLVCRDFQLHTLTTNKNAVFLCDEVVPLRMTDGKQ